MGCKGVTYVTTKVATGFNRNIMGCKEMMNE